LRRNRFSAANCARDRNIRRSERSRSATTLSPKTRRLLRVEDADQLMSDRVINELMGKDASARFRFIMERAEEAQELDL